MKQQEHVSAPGVTLTTVWQIGPTFPGVEKSTAFGKPALRVRGKLIACVPQ